MSGEKVAANDLFANQLSAQPSGLIGPFVPLCTQSARNVAKNATHGTNFFIFFDFKNMILIGSSE
jgi:hypothetical protein